MAGKVDIHYLALYTKLGNSRLLSVVSAEWPAGTPSALSALVWGDFPNCSFASLVSLETVCSSEKSLLA